MAEPHSTDQVFIRKLTEIVLSNLEDKDFGVKELALKAGMPQYSLIRKLHAVNKKTITQFIREVRLEKAKEFLQHEDQTASEVAFAVGFASPAYFNKCFHEYFGYPPGAAKKTIRMFRKQICNPPGHFKQYLLRTIGRKPSMPLYWFL